MELGILESETEGDIWKLKTEKATVDDGFPAEWKKNLGCDGIKLIHKICNYMWKSGELPLD